MPSAPDSRTAIRVDTVSKRYGRTLALDGVSFDVRDNELFALLGPNGAGKTTLLHILCTILRPDGGVALIGGFDVVKHPLATRRRLGIVFQEPSLDDRLTVHENLNLHGLVFGVPRRLRRQRIEEMLTLVELTEWVDKPARTLSSGMKRRLEIARALIHDSEILLFDEPTVGLDAQTRDRIWSYIRHLRDERQITLLVTTHYIEEVERCDRVCVVDHGKVIALDTPEALKRDHGQQVLRITPQERWRPSGNPDPLRGSPGGRGGEGGRGHPAHLGRRVRRGHTRRIRRPNTLAGDRGAEPGDGVPVADRPGVPRPGRRCPRAHPRLRQARRRTHPMTTNADTAAMAPGTHRSALLIQLGGLYGIWLREVKRAIRDRGQLVGGISRPILWVLILGIGLNPYFRGEVYGEVTFVVPFTYLQFIFPAVVALNIMFTSVQSAVSVIWDREFGFLREVLVSPMSRGTVLLGKVLGGATVAVVHGCLALLLARFADVPLTLLDVLKALGLMAMLAFALTSLGVVIANRIRSFAGFGIFSNAVILPLYFTSSSIFPLDPALSQAQTRIVYPEWLVTLVEYNPLTYAVDALRGVLINYNQFDPRLGIAVMAIAGVVLFAIALIDFRRA